MIYTIDKTGELKTVFEKVMKKYRKDLVKAGLNFLYVWRVDPKYEDNLLICAEVFKLSNRDRDLFGHDVRIEVDYDHWQSIRKNKSAKYALAEHELGHIMPEYDNEEDIMKVDKQGRRCFYIVGHDLDLRRFTWEMKKRGLSDFEYGIYKELRRCYKKFGKMNDPNYVLKPEENEEDDD